jgi:putative ABC transport system permease protein
MKQSRFMRNLKLGLKDLLLHKGRSILTSLGVVFGVGSVIAMLSVGEGASEQALAQIRRLGSNNILIASVKPSADDEGQDTTRSRMSIYGLLYDDEARIKQSFAHVTRTAGAKVLRKPARLGARSMELRIVGTTAEWFALVRRPLVAGRNLFAMDSEQQDPVCVLTEHGARRLLANSSTIGEHVKLGGEYFEVVGIISSQSADGSVQTPDQPTDVYIPMTVCRGVFGEADFQRSSGSFKIEKVELQQIIVEVDAMGNVERTAEGIAAMLRRFHPKEDYRMSIPLTLLHQAEATKRTFNIVLGSIAGISLLVGGIGIMNIMLASVTERTREIGIRRAIGAKRSQIVMQFLVETVVLSGLGGAIGIVMGVSIPKLITWLTGMPTTVPLYSILLSLIISMTIGIVFGLYPAIRAAKLDPIEALRHE